MLKIPFKSTIKLETFPLDNFISVQYGNVKIKARVEGNN